MNNQVDKSYDRGFSFLGRLGRPVVCGLPESWNCVWIVLLLYPRAKERGLTKYLLCGRKEGREGGTWKENRAVGRGEGRNKENHWILRRWIYPSWIPTLKLYSECKELGMLREKSQWFLYIMDGWCSEEIILGQFNPFWLLKLWCRLTQMSLYPHQSAYLSRFPESNKLKGNHCGSVIGPLRCAGLGGRHLYPWVTSCHQSEWHSPDHCQPFSSTINHYSDINVTYQDKTHKWPSQIYLFRVRKSWNDICLSSSFP